MRHPKRCAGATRSVSPDPASTTHVICLFTFLVINSSLRHIDCVVLEGLSVKTVFWESLNESLERLYLSCHTLSAHERIFRFSHTVYLLWKFVTCKEETKTRVLWGGNLAHQSAGTLYKTSILLCVVFNSSEITTGLQPHWSLQILGSLPSNTDRWGDGIDHGGEPWVFLWPINPTQHHVPCISIGFGSRPLWGQLEIGSSSSRSSGSLGAGLCDGSGIDQCHRGVTAPQGVYSICEDVWFQLASTWMSGSRVSQQNVAL